MTKEQFIKELKDALSSLPESEAEECVNFYKEMIDDRMEEGLSESDAVMAVGDVNKIASNKLAEELETEPPKRFGEQKPKKEGKRSGLNKSALAVGSPLWLTVAILLLVCAFAIYVSIWAVLISLWASFISFAIASLGAAILIVPSFFESNLSGCFMLSAALCCFALAIFSFFVCRVLTKYAIIFTKKSLIFTKKLFTKKEV